MKQIQREWSGLRRIKIENSEIKRQELVDVLHMENNEKRKRRAREQDQMSSFHSDIQAYCLVPSPYPLPYHPIPFPPHLLLSSLRCNRKIQPFQSSPCCFDHGRSITRTHTSV